MPRQYGPAIILKQLIKDKVRLQIEIEKKENEIANADPNDQNLQTQLTQERDAFVNELVKVEEEIMKTPVEFDMTSGMNPSIQCNRASKKQIEDKLSYSDLYRSDSSHEDLLACMNHPNVNVARDTLWVNSRFPKCTFVDHPNVTISRNRKLRHCDQKKTFKTLPCCQPKVPEEVVENVVEAEENPCQQEKPCSLEDPCEVLKSQIEKCRSLVNSKKVEVVEHHQEQQTDPEEVDACCQEEEIEEICKTVEEENQIYKSKTDILDCDVTSASKPCTPQSGKFSIFMEFDNCKDPSVAFRGFPNKKKTTLNEKQAESELSDCKSLVAVPCPSEARLNAKQKAKTYYSSMDILAKKAASSKPCVCRSTDDEMSSNERFERKANFAKGCRDTKIQYFDYDGNLRSDYCQESANSKAKHRQNLTAESVTSMESSKKRKIKAKVSLTSIESTKNGKIRRQVTVTQSNNYDDCDDNNSKASNRSKSRRCKGAENSQQGRCRPATQPSSRQIAPQQRCRPATQDNYRSTNQKYFAEDPCVSCGTAVGSSESPCISFKICLGCFEKENRRSARDTDDNPIKTTPITEQASNNQICPECSELNQKVQIETENVEKSNEIIVTIEDSPVQAPTNSPNVPSAVDNIVIISDDKMTQTSATEIQEINKELSVEIVKVIPKAEAKPSKIPKTKSKVSIKLPSRECLLDITDINCPPKKPSRSQIASSISIASCREKSEMALNSLSFKYSRSNTSRPGTKTSQSGITLTASNPSRVGFHPSETAFESEQRLLNPTPVFVPSKNNLRNSENLQVPFLVRHENPQPPPGSTEPFVTRYTLPKKSITPGDLECEVEPCHIPKELQEIHDAKRHSLELKRELQKEKKRAEMGISKKGSKGASKGSKGKRKNRGSGEDYDSDDDSNDDSDFTSDDDGSEESEEEVDSEGNVVRRKRKNKSKKGKGGKSSGKNKQGKSKSKGKDKNSKGSPKPDEVYCKKYEKMRYEIEMQNFWIEKMNRDLQSMIKNKRPDCEITRLKTKITNETEKIKEMMKLAKIMQRKDPQARWGPIPVTPRVQGDCERKWKCESIAPPLGPPTVPSNVSNLSGFEELEQIKIDRDMQGCIMQMEIDFRGERIKELYGKLKNAQHDLMRLVNERKLLNQIACKSMCGEPCVKNKKPEIKPIEMERPRESGDFKKNIEEMNKVDEMMRCMIDNIQSIKESARELHEDIELIKQKSDFNHEIQSVQ